MEGKIQKKIAYLMLTVFFISVLSGCERKHEAYVSASTTIRDNTPVCLVPEASGTVVYGNELVSVDASNTGEGYVMIAYHGTNEKVKMQLTGPDYMTYTYDLYGNDYEAFPLSVGDGTYSIGVYENVADSQYATVFAQDIEIEITNAMGAFLYPNQYVNFNSSSRVVEEAKILVAPAHDDLEAINYVYNSRMTMIRQKTFRADISRMWMKFLRLKQEFVLIMQLSWRVCSVPSRFQPS